MLTEKQQIITLLRSFAEQRPGIEPGNYSDWRSYRNESASVTRDLQHARTLIRAVELSDGITADALRAAFRAFSGRLTLAKLEDGRMRLDYCTGQYFPTEFRKAVCAVCASALWDYKREHCMPAPTIDEKAPSWNNERYQGLSAGDWLRRKFQREYGRTLARRYFN